MNSFTVPAKINQSEMVRLMEVVTADTDAERNSDVDLTAPLYAIKELGEVEFYD